MAKRFLDTGLWSKPWFRELGAPEKAAWLYLLTNCDAVGVWDADKKLAEFCIGSEVNWEGLRAAANGNIEVLENGKWFLVDFCSYQYGELSESCAPHRSYLSLLRKHGLKVSGVGQSNTPHAVRKRLTEDKKNTIFLRDEFTCQYCGVHLGKKDMVIDHVIPIQKGGENEEDNLVVACVHCNSVKTDKLINVSDFPSCSKRVRDKLERVSKGSQTLKEKEEEKDKEKAKDKDKEKEEEKDLRRAVEAAFRSKNDGIFDNIPMERKNIIGIVAKARLRAPGNESAFIAQMMEALWKLKNGRDNFWRSQPFLPSTLNADKLWSRVLESMRREEVDPAVAELITGAAK